MELIEADWLAGFIKQIMDERALGPCLLVEDELDSVNWLQLLPEEDEDSGSPSGYLLNFPYRLLNPDPLTVLREHGVNVPPGTQLSEWKAGEFVLLRIRPDVPKVALALLMGSILIQVLGMPPDHSISVQVEYGY